MYSNEESSTSATANSATYLDQTPTPQSDAQQNQSEVSATSLQASEQQQNGADQQVYLNEHLSQGEVQRPEESERILNPFILSDATEIIISVGEPVIKETTMSKHTVYNIKGQDKYGPFDVYRRFNEFFVLKEVLTARWPGCFIPAIPPKEMGSTSQDVVEDRARFLNSFCNQMAKLSHLFYSDEFQQFLRSKDSDVTKHLTTLKKTTTSDIIDRYQLAFEQACQLPLTSDLEIKINSWSSYLKKALIGLKNYAEQLKNLTLIRKELNKGFQILSEEILPEYEKCLISEYVSNDNSALIFSNTANAQLTEFNQKFKESNDSNSFQHLYDMIKFELRDAEAFEESIKEKENLERKKASLTRDMRDDEDDLFKLTSGKKTVKAMFSSIDEQKKKLEAKIEQQKLELKNMDNLIQIIIKIIATVEIDRFRREKRLTYHRVLQSVADSEICNSLDFMNYWSNVNDYATKLLQN